RELAVEQPGDTVEVDADHLAELVEGSGLAQRRLDLVVAVAGDERERALGSDVEQLRLVRLAARERILELARHRALELEAVRLGAESQGDRVQPVLAGRGAAALLERGGRGAAVDGQLRQRLGGGGVRRV